MQQSATDFEAMVRLAERLAAPRGKEVPPVTFGRGSSADGALYGGNCCMCIPALAQAA